LGDVCFSLVLGIFLLFSSFSGGVVVGVAVSDLIKIKQKVKARRNLRSATSSSVK